MSGAVCEVYILQEKFMQRLTIQNLIHGEKEITIHATSLGRV